MKQVLFQLHCPIRQKLKVNCNNDNMYFICCSTNVDRFCIALQHCLSQIITSSLIHCLLFIHLLFITHYYHCKLNHSHSKNTGLETHDKVLLYVFLHVFFVGMCTVLRSGHMGKPNLNNTCLF